MRRPRGVARLLALAVCAAGLAGCSAIPKAAAMQVETPPVAGPAHPARVGVRVSGGQDFEFRISDAAFEEALRASLARAGTFRGVVPIDAADLRLDVVQGDGRGVETRELTVLWSLSRVDTRQTVWQEFVASSGRSHHFVGVVRNRRSLELAARENIRRGLALLAEADLSSAFAMTTGGNADTEGAAPTRAPSP